MRLLSLLLALLAGHISDRGAPSPTTVFVIGAVTDATNGAPLAGAQVHVEGLDISALTSNDGRYAVTLPTMTSSEVVIRVEHIGYGSMTKRLILDGETLELDFALLPSQATRSVDESEALEFDDLRSRADGGAVSELAASPAALREQLRRSVISQGRYEQNRQRVGYERNFQREGYERIYDNEFMAARANPLSTFGIDVDRASYANVRRFIREGRLPPADAVRIEELINYFTYDLPAPEGPDPFSVRTEVARTPWNPSHPLVRIGIQGRRVDTEDLPASNLVFLLDVSGSMRSPNKLPLLKSALRLLVNQLRPQDQVAIVVYAGAAGVVLDPTSGEDKERILDALARLEAGGSTAGGAGLQLAYDVARRNHAEDGNNRVILATDGDFNIGPSSDSEMVRLIEARRDEGTFLTVLGFGTGNLQDAKMEKLADHGNGNFAYIDTALEAHKVLVSEFGGTLRYKNPTGRTSHLITHPVLDGETIPSSDFTFAASVAAFGMVLRDSEYCGSTDLEAVLRWARKSVGSDREGYRSEFVRMVEAARQLRADGI